MNGKQEKSKMCFMTNHVSRPIIFFLFFFAFDLLILPILRWGLVWGMEKTWREFFSYACGWKMKRRGTVRNKPPDTLVVGQGNTVSLRGFLVSITWHWGLLSALTW